MTDPIRRRTDYSIRHRSIITQTPEGLRAICPFCGREVLFAGDQVQVVVPGDPDVAHYGGIGGLSIHSVTTVEEE